MSAFQGFPDAVSFLAELAANNNKPWFAANRQRYNEAVIDPALALLDSIQPRLAALDPEIVCDSRLNGAGSIFRIHRDTRFSADKVPYKTQVGIFMWHAGRPRKVENPGLYLHLQPGSSFMAVGLKGWAPDQMTCWRQALDDPDAGAQFDRIVARAREQQLTLPQPHYKRVPRGYPADHPRADFLRCVTFALSRPLTDSQLARASLADELLRLFGDALPALLWMARHVQTGDCEVA